jgi:hypothetical protein
MKPSLGKPRHALARWWLIGALVLAVLTLAVSRIAHCAEPAPGNDQSNPVVSSAWRIARGTALAAAGLNVNDLYLSCSGYPIQHDPKPHPTANLFYSSISPGDQIAAGEVLHATAIMECPAGQGLPVLMYGAYTQEQKLQIYNAGQILQLYDDGTHGDRVADDGLWEADLVWQQEWFDSGGTAWATIYLGFTDYYDPIKGASVELKDKSGPLSGPNSTTEASPDSGAASRSQGAR